MFYIAECASTKIWKPGLTTRRGSIRQSELQRDLDGPVNLVVYPDVAVAKIELDGHMATPTALEAFVKSFGEAKGWLVSEYTQEKMRLPDSALFLYLLRHALSGEPIPLPSIGAPDPNVCLLQLLFETEGKSSLFFHEKMAECASHFYRAGVKAGFVFNLASIIGLRERFRVWEFERGIIMNEELQLPLKFLN